MGERCRDRRLEKKMREGWLRRMIDGKEVDESFSDSTIDIRVPDLLNPST